MSDRVTINAGGTLFETTITTLQASGSHYFQALVGPTGETMNGSGRKKKRKRTSSMAEEDEEGVGEGEGEKRYVFLDRDPVLFGSCLQFMRSARLPSNIRSDQGLLDDLMGEAEFLGLESLSQVSELMLGWRWYRELLFECSHAIANFQCIGLPFA